MKIALISAFRNSLSYIDRYCEQMESLQKVLSEQGHTLSLVLGYGDSRDGTGEYLFERCSHSLDAHLLDVSHGGHHFGSIVHSQRFKQLAFIGNRLWSNLPTDAQVVGLVESDLIWKPNTLLEMASSLQEGWLLSPMVMHLDKRFYDTYAFIKSGINFKNDKPYHPDLRPGIRHYYMNSVGSLFLMDAILARTIKWPEEDVVVGFCRQALDIGYSIVLDSYLEVYHP